MGDRLSFDFLENGDEGSGISTARGCARTGGFVTGVGDGWVAVGADDDTEFGWGVISSSISMTSIFPSSSSWVIDFIEIAFAVKKDIHPVGFAEITD